MDTGKLTTHSLRCIQKPAPNPKKTFGYNGFVSTSGKLHVNVGGSVSARTGKKRLSVPVFRNVIIIIYTF